MGEDQHSERCDHAEEKLHKSRHLVYLPLSER